MVSSIKKGKNGTILIAASFGGVFRYDPGRAVPRFDQKSLYDKKPAVTEIMLVGQVMWVFANPGILEADDGSIWFGGFGSMQGVYRNDGKTITVF